MKNILMILGLTLMMNANAVEETGKNVQPTETEIAKNRACFQELEAQGCGTIEGNQEEFRACLSNAHMTMDDHCKKMLLNLYGSEDE